MELLRYYTGQRRVTILRVRCKVEFEADATAAGRELKAMIQHYYAKARAASKRVNAGRLGCRGCGR